MAAPLSVPLVSPVSATVVSTFPTAASLFEFKNLEIAGAATGLYEYGRYGNETQTRVEGELAKLEHGEAAALFPSGMAAITTTLFALCQNYGPGSHLLIGAETYRQTRKFCEGFLTAQGIEIELVEPDDIGSIEARLRPATRAVFIESPSNPYLRVADIASIAKLKERQPFHLIVDPTFASPVNQNAIRLGADIIVPSATKYLAGHNDLLAGVAIGSSELISKVRSVRGMLGVVITPAVAHQLGQYLHEVTPRVLHQNASALAVAQFLENHPLVERVWYPGLPSHPDHEVAKKVLRGFGGVVTFTVKGGLHDTARFIESCKLALNGPSFGGPIPLIEQPAVMSYYAYPADERARLGIGDNLVRLSVGAIDPGHLIDDLNQALSTLTAPNLPSPAEKSALFFPVKNVGIFLNSCGAASVYLPAAEAQANLALNLARRGPLALGEHTQAVADAKAAGGSLFRTDPSNISIVPNCAVALGLLANGFPFASGDEILTYRNEYPSNVHPWKLQQNRGVAVRFIEGETKEGKPFAFSIEDIAANLRPNTRIVALSHVQFTSGFAVQLEPLAELCKARGIDLVIDAAQSAGCLPVYPEQLGISAVVASGWKWLSGPIGVGYLYTSPEFRDRIGYTLVGPDHMEQGDDYLNHEFNPHGDGRKFEPSSLASVPARGLATAVSSLAARFGAENLWPLIKETQNALLAELPDGLFQHAKFPEANRSGILAFGVHGKAREINRVLSQIGIFASVRGGWLRLAPHFYVTPDEARIAGRKIYAVVKEMVG